jgi:hypothetical protein
MRRAFTWPSLRGVQACWRSRSAHRSGGPAAARRRGAGVRPSARAGLLLALCLTTSVASLAGCGLGEKEGWADRVTAAPAKAIAAGTVKGTLTAEVRITEAPVDLPPEAMAQSMGSTTTFVADLGAHRSLLEGQHLLHDDLVLHLRRADAEENDARPWLSLDLDDLAGDAGLPFSNSEPVRMPYTTFAIPPTVLVDLIGGALTGSLESLGADDIDGVAVRGYGANFDLEKMLTDTREDDYDEDRRAAVEQTFDTLDITGTVHPGRVWLDDQGRPRRFVVALDAKPRNRWTFEMTVTIDFVEWGVDAPLAAPSEQETIHISSISRLMAELGRSFTPEAAQ